MVADSFLRFLLVVSTISKSIPFSSRLLSMYLVPIATLEATL